MKRKDPFVTKSMLDQAVEAILQGFGRLVEETKRELRGEIQIAKKELKAGISGVETSLKTEIRFVKDDINGLTAELSDTPSRKEFNQLKSRVDKYHPTI